MQMKKALLLSILAATMTATAVSPVVASAAAVTSNAVQISQTPFVVNGAKVSLRTIQSKGTTLVSVRDIAKAIDASLNVSKGNITVSLNHKSYVLKETAAVKADGGSFVDPAALLKAVGAGYSVQNGVRTITSFKLLADIDSAVWAGDSRLIVSRSIEGGREDYLVDASNGQNELLLKSSNTSELVISPDGAKAAYTDELGAVYIIALDTKQSTKASEDSSIKNELQWSADGSSLYFLQGDKNSVIAKVNLADGAVSKVLEDKVDYKGNLSVSADGKKFSYTVTKQPKVTADSAADVNLDDVAIDATGTEPQIYFYDSAAGDNKALQLTKEATDKAFPEIAANGAKTFYVNFTNDEASVGSLAAVSAAGEASVVFADQDVFQLVSHGDNLYLLSGNGDKNAIYSVNAATGASKLLHTVSDGVTELFVSNGGRIAVLSNGQLAVAANGKFSTITR
ncbi:hypothetical protein [Paenibacillus sp. NPDC058071]|uniref:TolB family protein n=1 Tax=Paenibacillus sp. NPDC058071 TaxID=3346326 RepID=UPI0036DA9C86